jgi:rRNA maturation protein Rpf1
LIKGILVPENVRKTAQQIFDDLWMKGEVSKNPLKLTFSKLANFSKFSKV